MSLTSEATRSSASSGLTRAFWLGVAAIAFCLALLLFSRWVGRWCCGAGGRPSSPLLETAKLEGSGIATSDATNVENANTTERLVPPGTAVSPAVLPVSSGTTPSTTTPPATVATISPLQTAGSLLTHSPRSYGATVASNRIPFHPYNVNYSEASVPPVAPRASSVHFPEARHSRTPTVAPSLPSQNNACDSTKREEAAKGSVHCPSPAQQEVELEGKDRSTVAVVRAIQPRGRLQPLSLNQPNPNRLLTPSPTHHQTPRTQSVETSRGTTVCGRASRLVPALISAEENACSCSSGRTAITTHTPAAETPPKRSPPRNGREVEEGGEAATTQRDRLEAELQARRVELQRVQAELQSAQQATEHATATRRRVEAEVRDLERYKGTLDGIIAFTLRELEDAADGVDEAEAQMRRTSQQALQDLFTAQEALRHNSLILKNE